MELAALNDSKGNLTVVVSGQTLALPDYHPASSLMSTFFNIAHHLEEDLRVAKELNVPQLQEFNAYHQKWHSTSINVS